jgi:predicted nucleic acid-binding Zn ribbon protein
MRRNDPRPLKDIIGECLEDLNIKRILKEKRIIAQWENMLGKAIANRTRKVFIKNKTLYVHLNSSVARAELMMIKQGILEKINETAGEKLIDNIVIQ